MHRIIEGVMTLGFTSKQICKKCNNFTNFKIREQYVKQSAFLIPVLTQYPSIRKTCIVCEADEVFSNKERKTRAIQELESAKDINKNFFSKLSDESKNIILKRLNKIEAYDYIIYLNS